MHNSKSFSSVRYQWRKKNELLSVVLLVILPFFLFFYHDYVSLISFLFLSNIYEYMVKVYSENALSNTTIFEWDHRFEGG
jgi:hypothetical protein